MIHYCKEIDSIENFEFEYSICTLVSNKTEYSEMLDSFAKAGFDTKSCEYIYIDNTTNNKYDAYQGLNKFINKAKGKYIILCHQDILLNFDNREVLEKRIQEISNLDKNWAVIGNAGAVGIKHVVFRITEPEAGLQKAGNPPKKVISIDENFMLLKNEANLGLSSDLYGFHFYGTDLCIQADSKGYSSYVVNFNLLHKSKGNADFRFFKLKDEFINKYLKAWRGRYMQTTITKFYLSGSRLENWFYSTKIMLFLSRKYFKNLHREASRITD
jgi:hypothetical protein